MKVNGSKAAGAGATSRKKASGASGGSGFADTMRSLDSSGDAVGAGGVRSTGTVSALDALLALQQSGDALDSPKKAAMLRAKSMLEQLEAVRDGLLSGQLSPLGCSNWSGCLISSVKRLTILNFPQFLTRLICVRGLSWRNWKFQV